jgi:hypothetical protein
MEGAGSDIFGNERGGWWVLVESKGHVGDKEAEWEEGWQSCEPLISLEKRQTFLYSIHTHAVEQSYKGLGIGGFPSLPVTFQRGYISTGNCHTAM